jgi:hypothetical protein
MNHNEATLITKLLAWRRKTSAWSAEQHIPDLQPLIKAIDDYTAVANPDEFKRMSAMWDSTTRIFCLVCGGTEGSHKRGCEFVKRITRAKN